MDDSATSTTPPITDSLISAGDVVARLSELGLGPETIGLAVPIPQQQIKTILSVHRKVQSPEQAALTESVRSLAMLAIKKAATIIEFGPPEHRLTLIRTIISNATKLIGVEEDTTTAELRAEFDQLLSEMKDVQPNENVITDDFIPASATEEEEETHAVEIGTPASSTYYQDHEHGLPQSRFELR